MKKTLTALVLLAAATAFAQVDASEVGPKANDKAKEMKQDAKAEAKETKQEAKEESKGIKQNAKENWAEWKRQAGFAREEQGTFKAAQAFDINGTLEKAGSEEITLARPGLPPAVLDIRDQTMVKIDGKKADAKALKEGARVKAKFQLEGEETVAVSIDARSMPANKAVGGAGEAGKDAKGELKEEKEQSEKSLEKSKEDADEEMESLKESGQR